MAEHNYYIADEVRREMACLPQCFVILQYIDGHFDHGSKSRKATGGCAAICRDGVWKTEPCSSMPP